MLYSLNRIAKISHQVKLALGVLKSFVGSVKVTTHDFSIGIDIKPEIGIADSGDLEFDLPELFMVIAAATKANGTSLLLWLCRKLRLLYIFGANPPPLSAFMQRLHRIVQILSCWPRFQTALCATY